MWQSIVRYDAWRRTYGLENWNWKLDRPESLFRLMQNVCVWIWYYAQVSPKYGDRVRRILHMGTKWNEQLESASNRLEVLPDRRCLALAGLLCLQSLQYKTAVWRVDKAMLTMSVSRSHAQEAQWSNSRGRFCISMKPFTDTVSAGEPNENIAVSKFVHFVLR